MNVEELRTVQRTERQKDSLQHLRDSFYRDVADYIAERKAERERVAEEADDPFSSPEVSRLTDEIETAEEVVESIYERRVGKIVKRATFAAAGMATEDEGLTSEERDLFEDLVARIETNRATVLDTLAGEADAADASDASDANETADPAPGPTGEPAPEPAPAPAPADANPTSAPASAPAPDDILAEAMGSDDGPDAASTTDSAATGESETEPAAPASPTSTADNAATPDGGETAAAEEAEADRTTLRITRDVGEIFGVDEREYDLASEDVVTLPTPNAEPLLTRDAAERLDD
jgi:DNA replication factor GINS